MTDFDILLEELRKIQSSSKYFFQVKNPECADNYVSPVITLEAGQDTAFISRRQLALNFKYLPLPGDPKEKAEFIRNYAYFIAEAAEFMRSRFKVNKEKQKIQAAMSLLEGMVSASESASSLLGIESSDAAHTLWYPKLAHFSYGRDWFGTNTFTFPSYWSHYIDPDLPLTLEGVLGGLMNVMSGTIYQHGLGLLPPTCSYSMLDILNSHSNENRYYQKLFNSTDCHFAGASGSTTIRNYGMDIEGYYSQRYNLRVGNWNFDFDIIPLISTDEDSIGDSLKEIFKWAQNPKRKVDNELELNIVSALSAYTPGAETLRVIYRSAEGLAHDE